MSHQDDAEEGTGAATNVRVAVRCRPFNTREKGLNEVSCVRLTADQIVITNPEDATEIHTFAFDLVFDQDSIQPSVWTKVGIPILDSAFNGYNGTIFAYGQTGSGKTWSMQGAGGDLQGIIPRMNNALFDRIANEKKSSTSIHFLVTVSYFEIYNEIIFDLLDPSKRKGNTASAGLEIKEHPVLGVYVKDLKEIVVDTPQKLQEIIDQGMGSRTVASTQMNADSSRSHSVFTIKVHRKDDVDETKNVFAKVNLVDLAGSERVKSTGATGAVLKEGANINKSLSALGNVINALVESAKGKKNAFIPYRNSKLTRVLQESLGGNSITAMLAAMSPAGINFDETLSTLKYANRAKAIKIKAVKNEEASQISRLNDEIRLLKEKLMKQAVDGPTVTVDTSELEEKHRQQLKELEEAMQSTWTDKARISEQYDRERKKLAEEQEAAEKELREQRERNWKLLEEKGDLELALSHVRENVKKDATLLSGVNTWLSSLKEITKKEQQLGEQDTVVDVYRSSVVKDCQNLLKAQTSKTGPSSGPLPRSTSTNITTPRKSGIAIPDRAVLNQWKQIRERFNATQTEVAKWTTLQDALNGTVSQFLLDVESAEQNIQKGTSSSAEGELMKSLQLTIKLIRKKKSTIQKDISKNRANVLDISLLSGDVKAYLAMYEKGLKEEAEAARAEGLEIGDVETILKSLLASITGLTQFVRASSDTSEGKEGKTEKEETLPVTSQYHIMNTAKGKENTKLGITAVIGGGDGWTPEAGADPSSTYVQIALKSSRTITSLSIQGATIKGQATTGDALPIQLPVSGLTVAKCSGDMEQTKNALGEVMSWAVLLKNSPPEKVLKRPPVRFLFDLFKFIGADCAIFPPSIMSTTWEAIAEKKDKMTFMDEVLKVVSACLGVPAAVSASSIVQGTECDQTNTFLQHLALAVHKIKTKGSAPAPPAANKPDVSSWLTALRVASSVDGVSYVDENLVTTLKNTEDVQLCRLQTPAAAKFLRIYPVKWAGATPALRFSIQAIEDKKSKTLPAVPTEQLLNVLNSMKQASVTLYGALECLTKIEDLRKAKVQEEVKKKLDSLANEKQALEHALATEKKALTTEKQDLQSQLKTCLNQLTETTSLFEAERAMRNQIEEYKNQLEAEKLGIQDSLQGQIEENSNYKTELLKLQANNEKDRVLIETLRRQLEEKDKMVQDLKDTVEETVYRQNQWESEKEDLSNQISVLMEERDNSRAKEEELFEKLGEKTQDLEVLQDSYFFMTEKCNDFQDEVYDLREKVETYRAAMKDHSKQVLSIPTVEMQPVVVKLVPAAPTASEKKQEAKADQKAAPRAAKPGAKPGPSSAAGGNLPPPAKGISKKKAGEDAYDDDFE